MYLTETKQCTKCKQYLELSNFNSAIKNNKRYYDSKCRKCKAEQLRNYRKENNNKLSVWISSALNNSKQRAKERNLEHNLTKEWLLANLPKICPILGIELSFGGDTYNSPSLDRFDPNKGYTTDNVRIISQRANLLKNNATLEELEAVVRYMKNGIN